MIEETNDCERFTASAKMWDRHGTYFQGAISDGASFTLRAARDIHLNG